jgi:DNA-binding response OmpR family regulator
VDDEQGLCVVLALGLSSQGFRVHVATSGEDALVYYQHSHQTLDVVLLDINLPGISGPETLVALKAINPTIPVFLTSGEENRDVWSGTVAEGFVEKPYRSFLELAETLRASCRATNFA